MKLLHFGDFFLNAAAAFVLLTLDTLPTEQVILICLWRITAEFCRMRSKVRTTRRG